MPAIAAPVVRDGAAAVRNDEPQRREILEQIGGEELHERRRVGVDVVRAGRVEVRVARRADVDHRRHVELDHLFVERIPVLVGERRRGPVAAGRIGVQVAADEPELVDAALELARCSWPAARGASAATGRRRRSSAGRGCRPCGSGRCSAGSSEGWWWRRRCDAPSPRRAAKRSVTSVPRSRCSFSCAFSRLSRIWSSEILMEPFARRATDPSSRQSGRRGRPAAPSARLCSARGNR